METIRQYLVLTGLVSGLMLFPALAHVQESLPPYEPASVSIDAQNSDSMEAIDYAESNPAAEDSTRLFDSKEIRTPPALDATLVAEVPPSTNSMEALNPASAGHQAVESDSVHAEDQSDISPDASDTVTEPDSGSVAAEKASNEVYLDALNKEAQADDVRSAPTSLDTPTSGSARASRIRSIVSEALNAAPERKPQTSPRNENQLQESLRQHRRRELRNAVSGASAATKPSGDLYVSTLKREGNRTVVIDEATSKRPAIVLPTQVPGRFTAFTNPPAEGETYYRVRFGDSLWLIAKRFYGDGYRYPVIYEANKDRIYDEDILVVGQVLRIPPNSSE